MKRQFLKNTLGLSLLFVTITVSAQLLPPGAKANSTSAPAPSTQAGSFVEGLDYRKLVSPQPTESKGKIEVVEFFWYGCPHCNDLEPELSAWSKRQKKDVVLKRIPVAFRDDFLAHSQIFYALESMGKEAEFTPKVFQAIHTERKSLLKEEEIANWVAAQGLDQKAFMAAYKSFTVITKAKTANTTAQAYRVDGVPTIAVQGKYMTSPSIAGTKSRAIETLDFLVEQNRSGKL
jgi:thiol:disulfide interchange protein DsbA